MKIYNRWLADVIGQAPHRHIGLAYLPMWDVDAAVAEVEWAHDAGMRGVNFPAMRDGELPEYNRSVWEPLWSVCEELGMPLVTHVGAGTNARYAKLEGIALLQIESGGFTSRRAIWWLIFAGVFERHPGLKLVITETPGNWFPATAAELDAVWSFYDTKRDEPLNRALLEQVPRRPSEYMAENVLLRRQLRLTLRGRTGRRPRPRLPAAVGLGLPPPRGHVRLPRRPVMPSVTRLRCATPSVTCPRRRRCAWSDRTPSTSTALTAKHSHHRRRHRRPHPRGAGHTDRRGARRGQRHGVPFRRRRLELNGAEQVADQLAAAYAKDPETAKSTFGLAFAAEVELRHVPALPSDGIVAGARLAEGTGKEAAAITSVLADLHHEDVEVVADGDRRCTSPPSSAAPCPPASRSACCRTCGAPSVAVGSSASSTGWTRTRWPRRSRWPSPAA